jgi:predicted DNA-binding transcriptional regulator YafY
MSDHLFVEIDYVNWRGERSKRIISPGILRFAATEWHPEPQWLLSAWDVAKEAPRDFALKDILSWAPVGEKTTLPEGEMNDRRWQGIETCPDDGRLVWAWNERRPHLPVEPRKSNGNGWLRAREYGWTADPTHWMPMEVPDPPGVTVSAPAGGEGA